jgi:deazaflavin-dependent oxidoreductase (nitroreductase family)
MPLDGTYEPSPRAWVRDQVERYEATGGRDAGTLRGMPVVIVTSRGARSGKLRKSPLMRVEHDGTYVAVASMGGAPRDPVWAHNLRADPRAELQDGPERWDVVARELSGPERDLWWDRAVAAYPDYADYQRRTERVIPLFLLERA